MNNWSWWINSIPIFIGIIWKVIIRTADDINNVSNTEDTEEKSKKKNHSVWNNMLLNFGCCLPSHFCYFGRSSLGWSFLQVAIVFIPVFIILGLLLCCCIICGPCICCCRAPDDGAEFGGQYDANADSDTPWWEIRKQKYLPNEVDPPKPTEASPLKDSNNQTTTTTNKPQEFKDVD